MRCSFRSKNIQGRELEAALGSLLGQRLEGRPLRTRQRFEFVAADRYLRRGLDAEPYLLAADRDDRDRDALADHDLLMDLATENQHGLLPGTSPLRGRGSDA